MYHVWLCNERCRVYVQLSAEPMTHREALAFRRAQMVRADRRYELREV